VVDNFVPGGGVAAVTGGKVSFIMRFADIGASDATEHTDIRSEVIDHPDIAIIGDFDD
jgi:hypothetical protein